MTPDPGVPGPLPEETRRAGGRKAARPSRLLAQWRQGAGSRRRPTPTLLPQRTVSVFEAVLATGPDAIAALTVKV